MATTQILTSKTFSLTGQRWIHDEHGALLFEASRPKVFGRAIQVRDPSGSLVATIDPQTWKSHPTWEISSVSGDYKILQNIKSFERLYTIESGMFDGTVIEGGNFDQQFRIRHGDQVLAQASEQAFSLKGKHVVDVTDNSEQVSLLSAVVGIIISKEKQKARTNQNQNNR